MPARRRFAGAEPEQPPMLIQSSFVGQQYFNPGPSQYPNASFSIDSQQRYGDLDKDYTTRTISTDTEIIMTSRDRTNEFVKAIQSLQNRNISRAVAKQKYIRDARKVKVIQSYSEFMAIARHVGRNIASTYAKLEKMTMLAKRKSLFDDRGSEIQELTYIIKGDLSSLNQQIAKLQDVSKSQRNSTSGKHLNSHSSSVVLALQSKLATMSNDFKQILEVRTENLKQQKNRREQFSQRSVTTAMPPNVNRAHQGSLLLANEQVNIDLEGSSSQPLLPVASQTQQMLMQDDTDNYLQNRAETMQNIESTIVELGGIFQQLAHMVKEQEEMVERIDHNVQDAELNIEAAHSEILKYFKSVTSNRWLMIKIFGVLIFFFIFFIVFMA